MYSGGIKGGHGGICSPVGGSSPTCPLPHQKKKMAKSAIFSKFLDFCPLRNVFCPLDASPHKKISGAATACVCDQQVVAGLYRNGNELSDFSHRKSLRSRGGRTRLPKFKFSAKFPIGLHVILQIQIKKFENDCYIM